MPRISELGFLTGQTFIGTLEVRTDGYLFPAAFAPLGRSILYRERIMLRFMHGSVPRGWLAPAAEGKRPSA
ncbi:MAG TPA: hypothetical protein VN636_10675 [Acidimicrobiia bacterium]|nr:hypothetical protein [Acidimicrobiia bacterium]